MRGKIAVVLDNAPARFPVGPAGFHASSTEKLRELERRGAVGVIFLGDPRTRSGAPGRSIRRIGSGRPCAGSTRRACRRTISPGCAVAGQCQRPRGRGDLRGLAAHRSRGLRAAREGRVARFRSRRRGDAGATGAPRPHESHNVIGRLPGGDARLSAEHVVFTAHLDHSASARRTPGTRSTTARRTTRSAWPRCWRRRAARGGAQAAEALDAVHGAHGGGEGPARRLSTSPPIRRCRASRWWRTSTWTCRCMIGDVIDVDSDRHRALDARVRGAARRGRGRADADARPVARGGGVRAQRPVPVRAPGRAGDLPEVGSEPARTAVTALAMVKDFRSHRYHLPSDDLEPADPLAGGGAARARELPHRAGDRQRSGAAGLEAGRISSARSSARAFALRAAEAGRPQRTVAPGRRLVSLQQVARRRRQARHGLLRERPVSDSRNATMSPTWASVSVLSSWVVAITRTASGSVFTAPLCM